MNNTRLVSIDALRALAALFVFLYHVYFIGPILGFWGKEIYQKSFYYGEFGVDIFFVISGFVITLSSEGRSGWGFARSRIIRLIPAFLVCSIITLLFDITIPGVDPAERFRAWLFSLTFFPKLFGSDYLSSVYWTLSIEIMFYSWVFLLIISGLWQTRRNQVLLIFAMMGVANAFMVSSNFRYILENIFIARYIGHFLCGIILYELCTKRSIDGLSSVLLLIGIFLVCISVYRHNAWIDGLGKGGIFSIQNNRIMLVSICIFLIVYITAESSRLIKYQRLSRFMVFLGSLSYPFYLLHADLSFYSHAMFERNIFGMGVYASSFTAEEMISLAFIASVVLSSIVCLYLEPLVRTILVNFIEGVISFKSKIINGSLIQ